MKLLAKFPIVLIRLLNAQQFVPVVDIDQDSNTRRERSSLRAQKFHRSEQTRLHQRRIRFVSAINGKGVFFFRVGLQITNDAIRPEIGDRDFDAIRSRFEGRCHILSEWRLPENVG